MLPHACTVIASLRVSLARDGSFVLSAQPARTRARVEPNPHYCKLCVRAQPNRQCAWRGGRVFCIEARSRVRRSSPHVTAVRSTLATHTATRLTSHEHVTRDETMKSHMRWRNGQVGNGMHNITRPRTLTPPPYLLLNRTQSQTENSELCSYCKD